jgi:hypothetical protein
MPGLERKIAPNLKNTLALPDYSLEVSYLGDSKVAHDAAYRCKFELMEVKDPPVAVAADDVIPVASKGKKYRVMIHDNHAATSTDTADTGMNVLGGGADTFSKPSCYTLNLWTRDVRPAVGFRVTIKKWAAGVQVNVSPDEVFVTWKVEDPEEEYDQIDKCLNSAQPKKFIKDFFKYFKRKTNNASSKVDDNCSTMFGGARHRDGVIDACEVLSPSPFNAAAALLDAARLPRCDDPPGTPKSDPHRGRRGKSEVGSGTAPDGKPIGYSEVFFFPPPISGDNYAFSIGLVSGEGAVLDFLDPDSNRVKEYKTGPFTLWRKVTIDMLVTFDNVNTNYIVWNDVKNAYAAAFMEVVPPAGAGIVKFNQATWKIVVKKYFKDIGKPDADVNNNALYDYANYFLPALPGLTKEDCWTFGKQLAQRFMDRAYTDKGKTSPRTDLAQDTCPGLYVFLSKDLQAVSTALGMYMGEREFFMVTVGDATCTFTHEMGHALYLRHALTSFNHSNADHSKWITYDVEHTRGAWLDHDQKDAIVCTMAYENDYYQDDGAGGVQVRALNPVQWHFCGVCLLKLRFWDTVLLRDNAQFRKFIYSQMKPLKLANTAVAELGNFTIPAGDAGYIFCIAPAESTTNNLGGVFKKNVSHMTDGEWVSTVPARAAFLSFVENTVTYYNKLQADPVKKGKTQVKFKVRDKELQSNSVQGTVT